MASKDFHSQPLAKDKKYHYSVYYNHYEGPADRRDEDHKLSSKVLERLVTTLHEIGFDKVYHEGKFLPGANLFEQSLVNMVKDAAKVVVILTRGYVKNHWHMFKEQTCLMSLIKEENSKKFLPVSVGFSREELPENLGLTISKVVFFNNDWCEDEHSWEKIRLFFGEKNPVSELHRSVSHVPVQAQPSFSSGMSELQVDSGDLAVDGAPTSFCAQDIETKPPQSVHGGTSDLLAVSGDYKAGRALKSYSTKDTFQSFPESPLVQLEKQFQSMGRKQIAKGNYEDEELAVCKTCKVQIAISELRKHSDTCLPDFAQRCPRSSTRIVSSSEDDDDTDLVQVLRDSATGNDTADGPPLVDLVNIQPISGSPSTDEDASIDELVDYALKKHGMLQNPVEFLEAYQQLFLMGRKLDITECEDVNAVDTDGSDDKASIFVDRENLLNTASEEILQIPDIRLPLSVNFYDELAIDTGGPRREFFRNIIKDIRRVLFEDTNTLSVNPVHLKNNRYYFAGLVMGLSAVQGGPIFYLTNDFFENKSPTESEIQLRRGLDRVGLLKLIDKKSELKYVFINEENGLTVARLLKSFKVTFSEEGRNVRMVEKKVYQHFVNYVREVSSGRRRNLKLEDVLAFATGAETIPLFGFPADPRIIFKPYETDFVIPTSPTCALTVYLPLYPIAMEKEKIWGYFDYAFTSKYFGKI